MGDKKKKKRYKIGSGNGGESRPGELGDPIRAAGERGDLGSKRLDGI